jgi:uncharacterized hydrophobic protein (TIGR00271 family)
MNIIEGTIPKDPAWRTLVLLSPDEALGRIWQLSLALTRANRGQLVTAVFTSSLKKSEVARANEMISAIKAACPDDLTVYPLIVASEDFENSILTLVDQADIDLLLAHIDGPFTTKLNRVPCAVGAIRYDIVGITDKTAVSELDKLDRILVPTSGGPNTIHGFTFLRPVTPEIEVTALYVVPDYLGSNEEALGRARLKRTLNFVDATDRFKAKIITTSSVTAGIVNEAMDSYDLIMIGASQESSLDKMLFGNIPAAVVRQCKKPVMIIRQPRRRMNNLAANIAWKLQALLPRLGIEERMDSYVRIRRSARPNVDFYMLISLSAMIAALGLIVNSPAVVIGAMLVAPLMSPIVGTGMAIVLGDARFLRFSVAAVFRGAFLAILVGVIAGLLYIKQPTLNSELLARTQPTLIDLGIALFSGFAGAYALCRSDAAGALPGVAIAAALVPPLATVGISLVNGFFTESFGALLLFTTNFIAISSATAIMFLILGFRPSIAQKSQRSMQARSVRVALILLGLIALLLFGFTYRLAQENAKESRVVEVVQSQLTAVAQAELDEISEITFVEVPGESGMLTLLTLDITARAQQEVPFSKVVELRDAIGATLQNDGILDKFELTMTVIQVTGLNPRIPPTATQTPTATSTLPPGVTPSVTPTDTPPPTLTPQPTETAVPTNTPTLTPTATGTPTTTPLPTLTPTAAPVTAVVIAQYGVNFRDTPKISPDNIIIVLEAGQVVILRDRREMFDGIEWQQIELDGVVGWLSLAALGE